MKLNNFIQKNQFLFLVLIVIFIGVLWRVFEINTFKAFSAGEITILSTALTTIHNHFQLAVSNLSQAVFIYFVAIIGQLSHFNPLAFRFIQATIGILSSVIFFLFVKSWFNKQVALISTLFFTTNAFLIILSRAIDPAMLIILLQLLILYVLTIAFREKNIYLFVLGGLLAGLGFYLSPFFVLSGILIMFAGIAVVMKNKKILAIYRYELIALIISVLAAASYYFYRLPLFYSDLFNFFNPGSIATFYLNMGANVLAVFSNTQTRTILNVGTEPLVDPFIAVTFFCGVIYALFHSNKRKYLFLMLWLLAALIVISLANFQGISNLVLLMPALFIFSASILDYVLTNWTRTFPFNRSAKLVMALIFSLFLFLSVYYNYQKFFYGWQENQVIKSSFTKEFHE